MLGHHDLFLGTGWRYPLLSVVLVKTRVSHSLQMLRGKIQKELESPEFEIMLSSGFGAGVPGPPAPSYAGHEASVWPRCPAWS